MGNDGKVEHLIDNLELPRNHIFNSQDDSFLPDVMRETKGGGVDIVSNLFSGALLHASGKYVAECGKLVGSGKRDIKPLKGLSECKSSHLVMTLSTMGRR